MVLSGGGDSQLIIWRMEDGSQVRSVKVSLDDEESQEPQPQQGQEQEQEKGEGARWVLVPITALTDRTSIYRWLLQRI